MTIIGCMVAYNEAELIGPAIDSMWRIGCDRVVVVDGAWSTFDAGNHYASTDGTQEIAIAHGAEVIEAPDRRWDDQTEARSMYLQGEPGDWYIVCDADERCQGWLPDLTGDIDAYLVPVKNKDGTVHVSRMRLFRHSGERLWYQHRHYIVYADGRLIEPTAQTDTFWLEHAERPPERQALKDVFYPEQREKEQAMSVIKQLPPVHLGRLEYIGGGAWLPGIPARNLTDHEADHHYFELIENLRGPQPIYQQQQQFKPVQDEQDDQLQQQSEPADDLVHHPKKRTQRRKEK